MKILLAHDHYDEAHLEQVATEMQTMGAPTIKAVYMPCWDAYVALEGCHRIRAAKRLGLTPEIDEVEWSNTDLVMDMVIGIDFDGTIEQFCDTANSNEMIEF